MIPPERKIVVEKSTALVARADLDQPEPREEECDHHGGEYFEEAFNPEVNHPPAPVFGGDEVAALAVHQAGARRTAGWRCWRSGRATAACGLRSCA